jgi:hypothetical protein
VQQAQYYNPEARAILARHPSRIFGSRQEHEEQLTLTRQAIVESVALMAEADAIIARRT